MRRRFTSVVGALVLVLRLRAFADDYGGNAATAFSVPGTNPVAGVIETDIDKDWFSFSAMPAVSYSITVSTGTLWDSQIALVAPDGTTGLFETSSVGRSGPAVINWTNNGPLATYFLRVGGFAEFTTGSYTLVIGRPGFVDSNTNGIPDSWELQNFGSLTNPVTADNDGDGNSNLGEYYAGTSPTNAASGVFLTRIQRGSGQVTLTWPAVKYGSYRVLATTNVLSPTWPQDFGTTLWLNPSGDETLIDAAPASGSKFYHLEFLY